ncbi:2-keto-4-pentenoate hydratase [Dongia rigui]|uniref:Fumarylacetoacetate hydrolase family protein n=1 Tax=Dongia rigui TaxID=940149 RepID=A0ABU5DU69_9PROT|nr:fumarylacetoacetate hydrolase family protein [Dongia rigui]MDY0870857.1 fumarylacetoacetate hydrolase family protein [Dongia rigui]
MKQASIDKAADILWRKRLAQARLSALPAECKPATLDEGYAVQAAMVGLAGQAMFGWKIAATSAAGQKHIGVTEPLAGRLFKDFVLPDGASLPAAPLQMLVVEAEFAFRMRDDLPQRAATYDVDEVRAAVADLYLAIEIPDARFEPFDTIGPAQIAADDAFAAWFVLGPKVTDWATRDLPSQPVRVFKNGVVAAEGTGANALGDPSVALTWLANERAKRGPALKAGDVITTGTCITPLTIAAGDAIVAEFPGLGRVSVNLT